MKLENQVVSLELAQKLKDLGVKQESLFYWCFYNVGGWTLHYVGNSYDKSVTEKVPAYTVAELGEMLPEYTEVDDTPCHIECYLSKDTPNTVVYSTNGDDTWLLEQEGETEADARAKMLIYLLENKLITDLI